MQGSDRPYALSVDAERMRRVGLLSHDHMRELERLVQRIRINHKDVASFDPCDGGVNARVLLILEAPGRKAVQSGFISRNNPDQTAKNFCELLEEAELSRKDTIIWNIVPWYVGDGKNIRPVKPKDVKEAEPFLHELLALVPNLKAVGLVGRKAQTAAKMLGDKLPGEIVCVPHPSPIAMQTRPHQRAMLLEGLKIIARSLG
jgi:uracil-DNA glycosylase family 4